MAYDLTILRVGALADEPRRGDHRSNVPGDTRIIATFRDYAKSITTDAAYAETRKVTERILGADYLGGTGPNNSIEPVAVTTMPDGKDWPKPSLGGVSPVVALLPPLQFACEIGAMEWIVRTRASVTACAVPQGVTKLWWTYEAIPKIPDPNNRPTEKHVSAFFAKANKLADDAMIYLHTAFSRVVLKSQQTSGPRGQRIRISMADDDSSDVAAFSDALYFNLDSLSQVRRLPSKQPARLGLERFESFVEKVTGASKPLVDDSVTVTDDVEGTRGLLFRQKDAHQTVVAGLARPAGPSVGLEFMSPAQQRKEKEVSYLRGISAARPISAWIASEEARTAQGLTARRLEPA